MIEGRQEKMLNIIFSLLFIIIPCRHGVLSFRINNIDNSKISFSRSTSLTSFRLFSSNYGGGGGNLPRDKLLKGLMFYKIDKDKSNEIIEIAEESYKSWSLVETAGFLTPLECDGIENTFREIVGIGFSSYGGFPQADRKRGFFERNINEDTNVPPMAWKDDMDSYIAALKIEGNFMFDKASVDDVLTSIMSIPGLKKEAVGDIIIVGERGANVLVMPQTCERICSSLKQIRSVPVTANRIELKDLSMRPPSVKEMTSVEASLRIDAVISTAIGISRSKMVKMIENGEVAVEYKVCNNSAYNLLAGQTVKVEGVGKIEIIEVGQTSKGRFRVKLKKYV